jgi:hypothetical protein
VFAAMRRDLQQLRGYLSRALRADFRRVHSSCGSRASADSMVATAPAGSSTSTTI